MYVVIIVIFVVQVYPSGSFPFRVTIDCVSQAKDDYPIPSARSSSSEYPHFNVDSFCNLIHNAIPKSVKDGHFVLIDSDLDQTGYSDTQIPMVVSPPKGFIPKLGQRKSPKLSIPKLKVPKLKARGSVKAPRVGSPMHIASFRDSQEEESSAERMEKIKKGIEKMLHFVKLLGQIDQYLSERVRFVVDKLSKTLTE